MNSTYMDDDHKIYIIICKEYVSLYIKSEKTPKYSCVYIYKMFTFSIVL